MRRAGFGVLLVAWLYGVPFLLIVGLIRRTADPYLATRAAATAFGAATDTILVCGLVLNAALPAAGLLLAALVRADEWKRRFTWALGGTALMFVAVALVAGAATAPVVGHVPDDREPKPRVTQCIPISGGRGCPGG
ncbi:hypothetical protein [Asanoa siamensis]|uniref:Integral membrane protein n=1 Tax=Asanoa siamensis TaxID=926357 RepID=A0ABQ4D3X3_9ACTN|nr:hypothetical protein [Asanoa siamensis]GIF78219.1 hypothetical protein Asi02nite_77370 [Asanoa siamensis]